MRSRFLIQTCVRARTRVSRISTLASMLQQGCGLQGAQGEAHITLEDALAPGALHAAFILPSLPKRASRVTPSAEMRRRRRCQVFVCALLVQKLEQARSSSAPKIFSIYTSFYPGGKALHGAGQTPGRSP